MTFVNKADGTGVANCEGLNMPKQRRVRQSSIKYDSTRATRGAKGRAKRKHCAINLAKGREAMALKRAALPADNHLSPDVDVPSSVAGTSVDRSRDVPSPVAGTSKDRSPPQSRGYHPPYKVRRPDRNAQLKAAKHGCDDTSSDNEDVLPDPVTQVRGEIAAVLQLPSQSRSTTHTRSYNELEELKRVSEAMKPTSSKRGADPTDDDLSTGKEIAGKRRRYRLSRGVLLDYGNEWDDLVTENRLVSIDFLNELYKCTTICYKCDHVLTFQEVGTGTASTVISKCSNEYCEYDNTIKNHPRTFGKHYTMNLSVTYETILQDSGFVGLVRGNEARGLPISSSRTYEKHAKVIYNVMDEFYNKNLSKIHNDVKSFFQRNFNSNVNYENGEFLDICVSVDGSYSHMGKFSLWGVTFICEVFTGRLIDFEITEKCSKCDKCDEYSDNGKCKYGKYHGSSGGMELHNAIVLFKRSRLWGFQYTEYVSDGDASVLPKLRAEKIYGPEIVIEKVECANHLAKRAANALWNFGKAWKPDSSAESSSTTASSGTASSGTAKALEKAAKGTSAITNFVHPDTSALSSAQTNTQPVPSKNKTTTSSSATEKTTASSATAPSATALSVTALSTAAPSATAPSARAPSATSLSATASSTAAPSATAPSATAPSATTPSTATQSTIRRSTRISKKPVPVYFEQTEESTSAPVASLIPIAPLKPDKKSKIIYPLRKLFSWPVCSDLSQRYRLAVYQNMEGGPEAQSTAVKGVLFHEMDYPEASLLERETFHQYCGDWCAYKNWQNQDKPLENFIRETKRDFKGDEVKWEGGILANFQNKHADAFEELLVTFEKLGNEELMSRCGKFLTQNINESVHAKMWKHCLKIKKHGIARYRFCAMHVVLVHNFGHYAGSLHHVLGSMTKTMQDTLQHDDIVSQRVCERKHELKKGGKKTHRVKKNTNSKNNIEPTYEPGCEPI